VLFRSKSIKFCADITIALNKPLKNVSRQQIQAKKAQNPIYTQ